MIRTLVLLLLGSVLTLSTSRAQAQQTDSIEACFTAYEETQVKLKKKIYSEAREIARSCSSGCPKEIAEQCQKWSWQAEQEAPSVLLVARLDDGEDAPGVSVAVDGNWRPLQKEVLLDPGKHAVRFSREDGWEMVLEITIHAGEKRRTIKALVPPLASDQPEEPPPSVPEMESSGRPHIPWAVGTYTLGAVGLGVASTFTFIALDRRKSLDECAPTCSDSEVQRVHDALTVADIGLGIGIVGVVAGTSILLWGKPSEPHKFQARMGLIPTRGGAAGLLEGHF